MHAAIYSVYALVTLSVYPSLWLVESRINCHDPEPIPNGNYVIRRKNMRITCNPDYSFFGTRIIECIHGKWIGDFPVCAKRGCAKYQTTGRYPKIVSTHFKSTAECLASSELHGNAVAYCNGTAWDRELGVCKERPEGAQLECDFEGVDLCGWTAEDNQFRQWSRKKASQTFVSMETGPRHDHTTMQASGGHYMLMESTKARRIAETVAFVSPIYNRSLSLSTACCFRFFYFMYGAGVGTLSVYVKPESLSTREVLKEYETYLKFVKTDNQGPHWHEGYFKIDEFEEDFQIVFAATAGKDFSDIAIDDVKLMIGEECRKEETATTELYSDSTDPLEEPVYSAESCASRCSQKSGSGFRKDSEGNIIKLCNCHEDCEEDNSCCPDYRDECLEKMFTTTVSDEEVAQTAEASTTTTTTTSTRKPTTTTTTTKKPATTTTTTKKPTTTTTTTRKPMTTTTTTRKPTTKATTTTTTTTKKPIPLKTTSTTTTTKKPTATTTTTTTKKPTTTTTTKKPTTSTKKPTTTTTTRRTSTTTRRPITIFTRPTKPNTIPTREPALAPKTPTRPTTLEPVTPQDEIVPKSKKTHSQTWLVPKHREKDGEQAGSWMTPTLVVIGCLIASAVVLGRLKFGKRPRPSPPQEAVNSTDSTHLLAGAAGNAARSPAHPSRLMQGLRRFCRPKWKVIKYGARDASLIDEDDELNGSPSDFSIPLTNNDNRVL